MTPDFAPSILLRVKRILGGVGPVRIVPAAAVVALLLAGCGGGQGGGMMGGAGGTMNGRRSTMMGGAATPTPASTTSSASDGRALFVGAGCGSCHTLAAAGADGTAGPNLDQARPTYAVVMRRLTEGGNGMPAFAGSLTRGQMNAIARYVSNSTR